MNTSEIIKFKVKSEEQQQQLLNAKVNEYITIKDPNLDASITARVRIAKPDVLWATWHSYDMRVDKKEWVIDFIPCGYGGFNSLNLVSEKIDIPDISVSGKLYQKLLKRI